MLEVEVKIKADNNKTAIKLETLGFVKGTTVYEKDVYYNGKLTDLKKEDKALRIREHRVLYPEEAAKTKYVLNFKGPKIDESTMTREETQFEVPDLESGQKVINGLGFFAAGEVEKVRTHYKKDNITCCLDNVTGLGEFLEIEIMSDESGYDKAVKNIEELLNKLGLNMGKTVRHSYLSMLMA